MPNNWINLSIPFVMKIAGRYARQFSRQSFTSLRCVQAGIAGYPNVRLTLRARENMQERLIYHYTTMDGFLGIINSGKFWASNILYQNDNSEFDLGKDLILNSSLALLQNTVHKNYDPNKFREEVERDLFDNEMCSISFSCDRCSLNQFRSYGKTFPSYALGFRRDLLKDFFLKNNVLSEIIDCEYDKEQQESIVENQVQKIFAETYDKNDITNYELNLAAKMITLAPRIKHESFREEKEVRALFNYLNPIRDRYKFRAGKSYIIPYLEVDLDMNELLAEIIVGPSPNKGLSMKATKEFCAHSKTLNKKNYKIIDSDLPYRGW